MPEAVATTTVSGASSCSTVRVAFPLPFACCRQRSACASAGAVPAPVWLVVSDQSLTETPVTEVVAALPTRAAASEGAARPTQTSLPSLVRAVMLTGLSTRPSTLGSSTTRWPLFGLAEKLAFPERPRWLVNHRPIPASTRPARVSAPSTARLDEDATVCSFT